jgi:hypothetical protein
VELAEIKNLSTRTGLHFSFRLGIQHENRSDHDNLETASLSELRPASSQSSLLNPYGSVGRSGCPWSIGRYSGGHMAPSDTVKPTTESLEHITTRRAPCMPEQNRPRIWRECRRNRRIRQRYYERVLPIVLAAYAPQRPLGPGRPAVESRRVCRSASALIWAPSRTMYVESQSHVRSAINAPREP